MTPAQTPEFSRTVALNLLGSRPRQEAIAATSDECAALAARFGWIALDRLNARFDLIREGDTVTAKGTVEAALAQACVVTGEAMPVMLAEAVTLRFVPPQDAAPDSEIELSVEDADTLVHDGQTIDIGEAAAETVALALDPYPRSSGADAVLKAAGVTSDDEAVTGPFAALKSIRDR